jgi:hypothetical protein
MRIKAFVPIEDRKKLLPIFVKTNDDDETK